MQNKLAEICEALHNLVQNSDARIYVSSQDALDESGVFGTTDAYLRFASELIKFVRAAQCNEVDTCEIEGVKIQTSGSILSVFDSCSEIRLNNSDLVSSQADARKLFEYWWSSQQGVISRYNMANFRSNGFQDCDFTDTELTNCKTAGMRINGILLQDLLDKGNEKDA
ncbi:MAG TPA: hypothetical protein VF719_07385 [Abditibacteriaceae bacterium]|jgi:hypothetical protein